MDEKCRGKRKEREKGVRFLPDEHPNEKRARKLSKFMCHILMLQRLLRTMHEWVGGPELLQRARERMCELDEEYDFKTKRLVESWQRMRYDDPEWLEKRRGRVMSEPVRKE